MTLYWLILTSLSYSSTFQVQSTRTLASQTTVLMWTWLTKADYRQLSYLLEFFWQFVFHVQSDFVDIIDLFAPFWHTSHSILKCLQNCVKNCHLKAIPQVTSDSVFLLASPIYPPSPLVTFLLCAHVCVCVCVWGGGGLRGTQYYIIIFEASCTFVFYLIKRGAIEVTALLLFLLLLTTVINCEDWSSLCCSPLTRWISVWSDRRSHCWLLNTHLLYVSVHVFYYVVLTFSDDCPWKQ